MWEILTLDSAEYVVASPFEETGDWGTGEWQVLKVYTTSKIASSVGVGEDPEELGASTSEDETRITCCTTEYELISVNITRNEQRHQSDIRIK